MNTTADFSQVTHLPGFPGPVRVTRRQVPDNDLEATAAFVESMQQAAIEDSEHPAIIAATRQALAGQFSGSNAGLGHPTKAEACAAIFQWICTHVRFEYDDPFLSGVLGLDGERESLIRPATLLQMSDPAEDCDGFTTLACSMMICAGIPCRVVTIKADPDEPDRFSHVYARALCDPPICMDCAQGAQHAMPFGWEPPQHFGKREWAVMKPAVRGLHGYGLGACIDEGGDGGVICYPDTPAITGGPTGIATQAPIDWNTIFQSALKGGLNIGQTLALPTGSYITTGPNGQQIIANGVPGAIPGQYGGLSLGSGGIGTGTILLGVGVLALFLLGGKH